MEKETNFLPRPHSLFRPPLYFKLLDPPLLGREIRPLLVWRLQQTRHLTVFRIAWSGFYGEYGRLKGRG